MSVERISTWLGIIGAIVLAATAWGQGQQQLSDLERRMQTQEEVTGEPLKQLQIQQELTSERLKNILKSQERFQDDQRRVNTEILKELRK